MWHDFLDWFLIQITWMDAPLAFMFSHPILTAVVTLATVVVHYPKVLKGI
jgi:hypothetical protein